MEGTPKVPASYSMSAKLDPVRFDQWLQGRLLEQLADAVLLRRFQTTGDAAAFAVLVRRHGPMVRDVVARLLANAHDRDDAFQATFLVLVKAAGSIRRQESVASWLFGVARRVALKAQRRRPLQPLADGDLAAVPASQPCPDELATLDEEIARLPDRYRLPILLCCLQGNTLEQAAERLGWPKGSVAGRLARAKELLRRRLERRGVSAAGLAGLTAAGLELSAPTVDACVAAAAAFRSGGAVSQSVLNLTKGACLAMTWNRLGLPTALGTLLLASAGGGWMLASGQQTAKPATPPASETGKGPGTAQPAEQADWWLVFQKGDQAKAARPDGKETRDLPVAKRLRYDQAYVGRFHMAMPEHMPINGVTSPDGQKVAFIGEIEQGKAQPHPFHGYLVLANADGSEPRLLTADKARRGSITWSPDGKRLAFEEETERRQQLEQRAKGGFDYGPETVQRVRVLDLGSGKILYTFGGETESIHSPRFTPRGRLSYLVTRGRNGKLRVEDLVVRILDGVMSPAALRPVTLVESQSILGWALNADESKLAYTEPGSMVIKNLKEAGARVFTIQDLNQKYKMKWGVCFMQPVWRPDGKAVACRCSFLGGRAAPIGGGQIDNSPIPGEEQVCIFPADDRPIASSEPEAFAFEPGWQLIRWAKDQELRK